MARERGTFKLPVNIEPLIKAPWDARGHVDYYEDLFAIETWQDDDGNVWLYKGMPVDVLNDEDTKNGRYVLLDPDNWNQSTGWKKVYWFDTANYFPPYEFNIELKDIPTGVITTVKIGDIGQNTSIKIVYQLTRGTYIRFGEINIININDTSVIFDGSYRESANLGIRVTAGISGDAINLILDVDNSSASLVDLIYNIQRMLKVVVPPSTYQYVYYNTNGAYRTYTGDGTKEVFTEGSTSIRKRVLGDYLYYDITLTALGFGGVEGIDWQWIDRTQFVGVSVRNGVEGGAWVVQSNSPAWDIISKTSGSNDYPVWREGIRGGNKILDHALNAIGFSGIKGVDWENIIGD